MTKLGVLLGLVRNPDGESIPALTFRTWHSWAAMAIAAVVVVGLSHVW